MTPAANTFKLANNAEISIAVAGDGTSMTLVTNGVAGTASATSLCAEAVATSPTAVPVGFQGLSDDLNNLPAWANVPSCGHGCPTFRLYHTNETGNWEIFRLDGVDAVKEETIRKNLSYGKDSSDMSPSLSPNNAWVVFTSNRDTQPGAPENWELYVAPTNGNEEQVRRVTFNTFALDTNPVWGPHQYVAFQSTRDGNWEIYLMDMETGTEYRVTDDAASDIHPTWSPDGSKLAFQSNRDGKWQIYVVDLAARTLSRLSDGTRIEVDPQFSPDGQRLAFRSYEAEGAESMLSIRDLGSNQTTPITVVGFDATNHAWSPSGSKIAYQAMHDGQLDVCVYELASRQTRAITDSESRSYAPTWLCDDNTVVFTSDATGQPDIFQTPSLPISAPSIDVAKEAERMTYEPSDDIYPEGAPQQEFASREGRTNAGDYGTQTEFLNPDVSTTNVDVTVDNPSNRDWKPLDSCPISSVSAQP